VRAGAHSRERCQAASHTAGSCLQVRLAAPCTAAVRGRRRRARCARPRAPGPGCGSRRTRAARTPARRAARTSAPALRAAARAGASFPFIIMLLLFNTSGSTFGVSLAEPSAALSAHPLWRSGRWAAAARPPHPQCLCWRKIHIVYAGVCAPDGGRGQQQGRVQPHIPVLGSAAHLRAVVLQVLALCPMRVGHVRFGKWVACTCCDGRIAQTVAKITRIQKAMLSEATHALLEA